MKKLSVNKSINILIAIFLVLGVVLAVGPKVVSANPGSVLAQGEWVYPETDVIAIEKTAKRYGIPRHLQLITDGMEFTFDEPTTICHGFYGAGKGWVPEFRYFWNYKWNAIRAKAYIVQDPKSSNMLACVKAPFSATYALFGYYPQDQTEADLPSTKAEITTHFGDKWSNGTAVKLNTIFAPTPEWLKLYSGAVAIEKDQWVQLCHPFREGANGWVGEIRQLKGDRWETIYSPSEEVYIPNREGVLNVCTWVGEGTYALFGHLE